MSEYAVGIKLDHRGGTVLPKKSLVKKKVKWCELSSNCTQWYKIRSIWNYAMSKRCSKLNHFCPTTTTTTTTTTATTTISSTVSFCTGGTVETKLSTLQVGHYTMTKYKKYLFCQTCKAHDSYKTANIFLPARRRPSGLVVSGVCLSVCLCVCAHCFCPQDISRTGSWITTKFGGWEQGVNL